VAIFAGGDNNGVLVERNTISAAGFSGIAVRDTLGAAPTDVDTVGNDVRDAFNHGIDVTATGVGEVEVRGNTVRKSHQDGLDFGVGRPATGSRRAGTRDRRANPGLTACIAS
jgi:hypothetical protein